MRVIAGTLGGRHFASPRSHRTHPMSDKVRGALFNILGSLDGLSVLDAYAGSGACGIEALSRGARTVLAIDIDPTAVQTIAANIRELGLTEDMKVQRANISSWLQTHEQKRFDIILADPPYDVIRPDILQALSIHVNSHGLFVVSFPGGTAAAEYKGFERPEVKSYGDAQLAFYRPSS